MTWRNVAAMLPVLWLAVASVAAAQTPAAPEALLFQARERFAAGEYESALSLLDDSIKGIGEPTDATRPALFLALELRGRVRFTLGNEAGAQEDFARLLALDPAHALPTDLSPRIAALFGKVRAATIGSVTLVSDPIDAAVQIDGRPAALDTPIFLPAGEHTITATRAGHNPFSSVVNVAGGSEERVTINMPRVSAVLTVITSPPGVEVSVNGVARATTEGGDLPAGFEDLPSRLGVSAAQIARPLVLGDLKPGNYTIQFRRPCYQTETITLDIEVPRDLSLAPKVMKPAMASLTVEASDPSAVVFIDQQKRGGLPFSMKDLCEGEHAVDVRSANGRYVETVTARAGGALAVKAVLKPTFVMLPVAGLPEGYRGQDPRLDVMRALQSARQLTFLTAAPATLDPLLAADKLRDDALAFDLAKRPTGSAALMTPAARREVVRKLCEALDVQGLAAVTVLAAEAVGQRFAVSLFARGGSEPDVFPLQLDQPATVAALLERLDLSPQFSMPALGMVAIDANGVEGVVVARVDEQGPARAAGLQPGERITQLGADALTNEATLARLLEERRSAETLQATVVGRDGTSRQVELRPVLTPRLISVFDRSLPFNTLTAQWRQRASGPNTPEVALVRLNLAVASLRIGDFEAARDGLSQLKLGTGSGVSDGTVQYLLGLAYKGLGDFARAREALTRAAAAEQATLSEHGGRVADFARQELQALGGAP